MKLNRLSYQIIELNAQSIKDGYFVDDGDFPMVSFELLIDGEAISSLLKTKYKAIPYYYFEDDLPKTTRNKERHLIGVCICGVDGCGRITCVLDKREDFVTFREFFDNCVEFSKDLEFRFSHENYDSIIKEMLMKANEYSKNYELEKENYDEN